MLDIGWFFGEENHHEERQHHGESRETVYVLPAEVHG